MERSSPLVDCDAFSTVPRTTAPAGITNWPVHHHGRDHHGFHRILGLGGVGGDFGLEANLNLGAGRDLQWGGGGAGEEESAEQVRGEAGDEARTQLTGKCRGCIRGA